MLFGNSFSYLQSFRSGESDFFFDSERTLEPPVPDQPRVGFIEGTQSLPLEEALEVRGK